MLDRIFFCIFLINAKPRKVSFKIAPLNRTFAFICQEPSETQLALRVRHRPKLFVKVEILSRCLRANIEYPFRSKRSIFFLYSPKMTLNDQNEFNCHDNSHVFSFLLYSYITHWFTHSFPSYMHKYSIGYTLFTNCKSYRSSIFREGDFSKQSQLRGFSFLRNI